MSPDYNGHLLKFIESTDNMLLKASDFSTKNNKAVFQLNSGVCQESFLTIWGLFKNNNEYNQCIVELSELIKEIKLKRPFNCIVTSTITAKHLSDRLHSFIEEKGQDVDLFYLGHNPFINIEETNIYQFESKNVIIVTDVIASGGLVKGIAESVSRLGGKVVAAVGVFLTGEKILEKGEVTYKKSSTQKEVSFDVYGLCSYPIKILSPDEIIDKELVRIDPETIFPIPNPKSNLPKKYRPLFTLTDFIAQAEKSESLIFGFYQKDNYKYTTAVNVTKFIDINGDDIWNRIKGLVSKNSLIATTFDSDDLLLAQFIEKRCDSKAKFLYIPEKESYNISQRYFIFNSDLDLIDESEILLTISSLHSFKTLSEITSLLALHGASKITVLCLFNRMGVNTLSFVTRIEQLLKGFEDQSSVYTAYNEVKELTAAPDGVDNLDINKILSLIDNSFKSHTFFEFTPIYSLSDISALEIYRMEDLLNRMLNYFKGVTKNESHPIWIDIDKKYLEFHKITNNRFLSNLPSPLKKKIKLNINGTIINCSTKDGVLTVIINDIAWHRNYSNLIYYLGMFQDKTLLYKIYAILISDINFIVNKNILPKIRNKLVELIKKTRTAKIRATKTKNNHKNLDIIIEDFIQLETNYIFGLSLFSYFDKNFDYESLMLKIIRIDQKENSADNILNNIRYFNSDRLTLVLSMLLHFSQEKFHFDSNCIDLKDKLIKRCDSIIVTLKSWMNLHTQIKNIEIQEAIDNLDNFEKEFSANDSYKKIDLIKFLNQKVIEKDRHHPIRNALDNIISSIEDKISDIKKEHGELDAYNLDPSSLENINQEKLIESNRQLKISVEQGFKAAGLLIEIANTIKQLIKHSTINEEIRKIFLESNNQDGFNQIVIKTVEIIQSVRKNNKITATEFQKLQSCRDFIYRQFFEQEPKLEDNSELWKILKSYRVNIYDILESSIVAANKVLKSKDPESSWAGAGFAVWKPFKSKVKNRLKNTDVVFDELELKEILVNALTNIRYSFNNKGMEKKEIRERVCIEPIYISNPDKNIGESISIRIIVKNGVILKNPKENSTFSKQANIMKEYGGSMQLYKEESTHHVVTELNFRALEKLEKLKK